MELVVGGWRTAPMWLKAAIASPFLLVGLGWIVQAVRSPTSTYSVVGSWSCRTQNPNGTVNQESWYFRSNGRFESRSEDYNLDGVYEKDGNRIAMSVQRVFSQTTSMTTHGTIDANVTRLDSNQLQFDGVVRESGNKRRTLCSRTED